MKRRSSPCGYLMVNTCKKWDRLLYPWSISSSPMDNIFMSSEGNYAKRVTVLNNMEVDVSQIPPSLSNTPLYNFTLPPSQPPHASHEEMLNPALASEAFTSMDSSPPMVIPYSTNIPIDPSLWDSNFTAISLFGTNEFLNSNIQNIACSLWNKWPTFSDKEILKAAMATTLGNSILLGNLHGISSQPSLKLGRINWLYLITSLLGTRLLQSL